MACKNCTCEECCYETTEVIPIGTRVLYHGSVKKHHGEMTVEGKDKWTARYMLVYGINMHEYLWNVRRESFTILNDQDGHA